MDEKTVIRFEFGQNYLIAANFVGFELEIRQVQLDYNEGLAGIWVVFICIDASKCILDKSLSLFVGKSEE